jgi:hypothetical protein
MKLTKKISALLSLVGALAICSSSSAAVANFESQAAFRCDVGNPTEHDGGLTFSTTFAACFYSVANPADFPTTPTSTVMATGFGATTVTLTNGGTFSLQTVDLAFGPFNHNNLQSDTTLVTGNQLGGGQVSALLNVDYSFDTYTLNWSNLTSVVFSELQAGSEYLAFDNVVYDSQNGNVPEPESLALFSLALAGLGLTRRKVKQA